MNLRLMLISYSLFVLTSCSISDKELDKENILTDSRENSAKDYGSEQELKILAFEAIFYAEDGEEMDEFHNDKKKFISSFTSVTFNNGVLNVNTLDEHNSCGIWNGVAKERNDSIFLEMNNSSKEACTSSVFSIIKFKVNVPKNQEYTVMYNDLCISCFKD